MVSAGQDGVIRVWGPAEGAGRGLTTEEAPSRLGRKALGGSAWGGGGDSPVRSAADAVCKRAVRREHCCCPGRGQPA